MYGFEAISAHNGWVMALAGALIVFGGLVVLSSVISQLHKLLSIWDKKPIDVPTDEIVAPDEEAEDEPIISLPKDFPSDINDVAQLYQPMIDEIGETFYLSDLYAMAKKNNYPHPHITFTAFREAGIIKPHGDGVFSWNQPEENEKG